MRMWVHSHFDGSWIIWIPTHQIWKAFCEAWQTLIISDLSTFPLKIMPRGSDLRRRQLIVAAAYVVNIVGIASTLYASPLSWKQAYHTSKLSSEEWVKELINGHHDRIWTELGVHVHVFSALVHELQAVCGLQDSCYVGSNEQVAIFLYMCVTGLSIWHVGERFQHSNETISK